MCTALLHTLLKSGPQAVENSLEHCPWNSGYFFLDAFLQLVNRGWIVAVNPTLHLSPKKKVRWC